MDSNLPRRSFLKKVQSAGFAAYAAQVAAANAASRTKVIAADITISGTAYTPLQDYPIQPKRYSEVAMKDHSCPTQHLLRVTAPIS